MTAEPARRVEWTVTRPTHEAAVLALADLCHALQDVPIQEWRLIGGLGVAVICGTYPSVPSPARLTPDADAGISVVVAHAEALTEGLGALGYERSMGSRFLRRRDDSTDPLVVDALLPAAFPQTRSAVGPRTIGPITASAAPGLKLALARPHVPVTVHATLPGGQEVTVTVPVPDEVALLVMKLAISRVRVSTEDATDVGSLLSVLTTADPLPYWPTGDADADTAADVAREQYLDRTSAGAQAFEEPQRDELRSLLARLISNTCPPTK